MTIYDARMESTLFGRFLSPLDARLITDDGGRQIELLRPLVFRDVNFETVVVPEGFRSDGASIPRALWWLMGHPLGGLYRRAAVIHDYECVTKTLPWQYVHNRFYRSMRADGTSHIRAEAMRIAVYRFGPRWEYTPHDHGNATPSVFESLV